jgi:hypothetical protein
VRHLSVLSCLVASGCFYTDTPNQRPSIDILQGSSEVVYRGDPVMLEANSNDPEGQQVFYDWRVNACVDANDFATCTRDPFAGGKTKTLSFDVPPTLGDGVTPTQSLRVVLEAQDDYGAIARPSQMLIIPVGNRAPSLVLRGGSGVADTIIPVYAEVRDADDTGANVTLTWTVYSPMTQPVYTFTEINVPDPMAPAIIQRGWHLDTAANGEGTYTIEVTATDPLGATFTQTAEVVVGPDLPPCLAQWAPAAAPAGVDAPLTEATLFQVSVVDDELDPYPTIPGDTFKGTPTFFWSLKEGAGARTDLAYQGNAIDLDPANYTVGDILELRVEITDRNSVRPTCNDNLDTCAVGTDTSCIQRLTWRVEVR